MQTLINNKLEHYLDDITGILDECMVDIKAKVYLFGSRAGNNYHSASDIDLAARSSHNLDDEISTAKQAFFDSHIPYKVDLLDMSKIGDELRKNIDMEGILIWEN